MNNHLSKALAHERNVQLQRDADKRRRRRSNRSSREPAIQRAKLRRRLAQFVLMER